jgi:exopolysaccharide biosynthesis protein
MKKSGKIELALGLFFGITLFSLTAYNLSYTFLIPHGAASAISYEDSTTSAASTTTVVNTVDSNGSTVSTTVTTLATSQESSPYSVTSVTASKLSTKNSYSKTISYHLVDIKLASYGDLKTRFANNAPSVNNTEKLGAMVSDAEGDGESVLAAINGDWAFANDARDGYVIRNGVVYRDTQQLTTGTGNSVTSGDNFLVYKDGTGMTINESTTTAKALYQTGCWQCFCFGPTLVKAGTINVGSSDEVSQASGANERTAIGYVGDHHFVFLVAEMYGTNRQSAQNGFSLYNIATIMKNYGCQYAYNLDGGGSSRIYYNGACQNTLVGSERAVGDMIYVKAN